MDYFWFRRDLRIDDNTGLMEALKKGKDIQCVFIFDTTILSKLPSKMDKRVSFIYDKITELKIQLNEFKSDLQICIGNPIDIWSGIIKGGDTLYFNKDYEPLARERDDSIQRIAVEKGAKVLTFKDQVIFEELEILTNQNKPYTVYTPYSKKWLLEFDKLNIQIHDIISVKDNFKKIVSPLSMPSLEEIGFIKVTYPKIEIKWSEGEINKYDETRDDLSLEDGTSRLGVALRFGLISIRRLVLDAKKWNQTFLKELIWREFFMQILYHFPHTIHTSFKQEYDLIEWRNDVADFEKWCKGETGVPIVDAGMKQLNETGFMHNRVRMIVASYLTKNLLIHWTWGEAYFAEKLMDYEQSSNVGNWQWAAGSGCDAAPYFRVFNPLQQMKKFDPEGVYIEKYSPNSIFFDKDKLLKDLLLTRNRAIKTYKNGLMRARETF